MGQNRAYFGNLDGLRFIGFLFIFFAHAFISNSEDTKAEGLFRAFESLDYLGFAGLDFFFVLSAFLITYTLLEEKHKAGNILYGRYFLRRSLRIWPLYFLIVGMGFGAKYIVGYFGIEAETLPPLWSFLTFTLNFHIASNGFDFLFFMVFLWSISVEEQFYIVWGFVMKFLSQHIVKIGLLLILGSLFFRWYFLEDSGQLMFNTLGALANFGVGAILAYAGFHRTELFETLKELRRSTWLLVYLLLIANLFFYNSLYDKKLGIIFERTFFAILFGLVVFEQAYAEDPLLKFGKWKWLRYLGNISYGLYMFHGIVITLFLKAGYWFGDEESLLTAILWRPLTILAITILLSVVSYEFFEKKVLNLKKRFT